MKSQKMGICLQVGICLQLFFYIHLSEAKLKSQLSGKVLDLGGIFHSIY